MTAPRPAMPVRWAMAFCVACSLAFLSAGAIAGYLLAERGAPSPDRYVVDVLRVPVAGDIDVWSVRWIQDGLPRIIQVEGAAARDGLVAWIGGGR